MSEPGFVVGGRYANTAGEYEVQAIEESAVRIRYATGFEMKLPEQGLWAQWEAVVTERTGRPAPAERAAATPRSATARAASGRATATKAEPAPRIPKPKKGATGDAGFYAAAGYLAMGCEITASVPGRDYAGFAQRYKILTGRGLITPHAGLDVHERPTHRMGAEMAVRFPAGPGLLPYLDFGAGLKPEPDAEPGQVTVGKVEIVERLLRLGFDLGPNTDPLPIREKVPADQQLNFDRGIGLRRARRN